MSDIRTILDTLLALAFMEAILKPSIRQAGKFLFRGLDKKFPLVPNWLYRESETHVVPIKDE